MTERRLGLVSVVLVGFYLLVGGLSTVCLTTADASASSHQHHSHPGMAHHSGLCAWACQANPTAAVLSSLPSMPSLGLTVSAVPTVTGLVSTIRRLFIPSRAPPR